MDIEFVVDEYIEKGKLIGDNETVDAIIAELAAAKEEIVRLKADLDRHADRLALEVGKSHAAETALASERKETERLRELLAVVYHYNYTPYENVPKPLRASQFYPQDGSTKVLRKEIQAALQSRQGEE